MATKLYDEINKLREDLINNTGSSAALSNPDLDSETLLKDLYGEVTAAGEYDVTTDPAYSSMKKAAYRESDRSMRDTLAQGNARTNGFANSAAITAASQARDYTMSQFDDKVADLEDRALSKANAKISAKMQLLSAVEGMEATKRQNYLERLEMLEQMAEEEKSTAESEALNIISMGGVPSDELLSKTGWSQEYINAVKQNTYANMDTAAMQRYLNSKGANLDVDGSWGPKTEAAYQAVFGKASGRQESYGYSSNSGTLYTNNKSLDDDNTEGGKMSSSPSSSDSNITNQNGPGWVRVAGYSRLTYQELQHLVDIGKIKETKNKDGTYSYRKVK